MIETLLALLRTGPNFVVHIAGHAWVDPDLGTYFVCQDGRCYHDDISNGNLKLDCLLLFASCCKSALNNDMALAFRNLGVRHFIGFRTSVRDSLAYRLVMSFYEFWLESGAIDVTWRGVTSPNIA